MLGVRQQSNFSQLKAHDEQLERLGLLAERYFADDPNTCLLKLRQLAEGMAQSVASRVGIYTSADERQIDLLRRLQDHGIVPREVGGLFHEIRKAGNDANHNLAADHRTALMAMRLAWQLGVWFHRTFKEPEFKSGPFIPPTPPADESAELKAELEALQRELIAFRAAHQDATLALEATQARVQQTEEERAFWEAMAAEAETAKHELAQRLETTQAHASAQPPQAVAQLVEAANTAAATLKLSEADNPLTISALTRDEVRGMATEDDGRISVSAPYADPKGMGFTATLTEIFGMPTSLDMVTQRLVDERNLPAHGAQKSDAQERRLIEISDQLARLGFLFEDREPLYQEFLRAWHDVRYADRPPLTPADIDARQRAMKALIQRLMTPEARP